MCTQQSSASRPRPRIRRRWVSGGKSLVNAILVQQFVSKDTDRGKFCPIEPDVKICRVGPGNFPWSRSQVGSRAGSKFVLPVGSRFRLRVSQSFDHARFPAPPRRRQDAEFPAFSSPACFALRFMGPISLGRLSAAVVVPVTDVEAASCTNQREFAAEAPCSTSAMRPFSRSIGRGGQPRMCRSTGTTDETPPTQA